MTKQEAELESIRRWRAQPVMRRKRYQDAKEFAAKLRGDIEFRTMGDPEKIIASWLIRDIVRTEQAGRRV